MTAARDLRPGDQIRLLVPTTAELLDKAFVVAKVEPFTVMSVERVSLTFEDGMVVSVPAHEDYETGGGGAVKETLRDVQRRHHHEPWQIQDGLCVACGARLDGVGKRHTHPGMTEPHAHPTASGEDRPWQLFSHEHKPEFPRCPTCGQPTTGMQASVHHEVWVSHAERRVLPTGEPPTFVPCGHDVPDGWSW